MRLRSRVPCLEELESRLVLSLPSAAPPLPPPPQLGPNAVWVNTEAALQAAFANLQSGETVVIQKGTYQLSKTLYIGLQHQVQNVTIRGATNDYNDVVLVGNGMENANYGNVPFGFSIYNAQNVTLADLSIGEVWYHPIELQGNSGASAIHVYHTRVFNGGEQLLKSNPNPTTGTGVNNSTVEYSLFEYTNGPPTTDHGGGTGYTNGVDVLAGSGWVVSNNLFRGLHTPDNAQNLWNPAVLFWRHTSNQIVEGNTFINTDRAIALGLAYETTGYDNQGGIVRNNFIYQSPGLFSTARKQGADGQIIVWDSPNSVVYHNTILTNGNSPASIQTRWVAGTDIRNNLADAPLGARDGATFTQGGNYLSATLAMFVNPATADLHLVSNSATQTYVIGQVAPLPSVTADWDGNPRPAGVNTDIGASRYIPINSVIVDNSDPGYAEAGANWHSYHLPGTYGPNYRYHAAGTGVDTATWTVRGLAAGTYDVEVAWTAYSNRATNAPYRIYDGATLLATVLVNQQLAPTGTTVGGATFQSLGHLSINSGTLKVVLSDNANQYVIADAIRVVPVSSMMGVLLLPSLVAGSSSPRQTSAWLTFQGGRTLAVTSSTARPEARSTGGPAAAQPVHRTTAGVGRLVRLDQVIEAVEAGPISDALVDQVAIALLP
jgi:hypothetical protein